MSIENKKRPPRFSEPGDSDNNGVLEIDAKNWRGMISGVNTNTLVIAIVLLVCFGLIAWQWTQQRDIDRNARVEFAKQHTITQGLLNNVISNTNAVIAILNDMKVEDSRNRDEIAYILTRTETERKQLNLQMPKSLRERIRSQ